MDYLTHFLQLFISGLILYTYFLTILSNLYFFTHIFYFLFIKDIKNTIGFIRKGKIPFPRGA